MSPADARGLAPAFPFIAKVFADSGYSGEKVESAAVIAFESEPKAKKLTS
jgi:hypothetical protein